MAPRAKTLYRKGRGVGPWFQELGEMVVALGGTG